MMQPIQGAPPARPPGQEPLQTGSVPGELPLSSVQRTVLERLGYSPDRVDAATERRSLGWRETRFRAEE